jgi:hypothetical protein
MNVDVHKLKFEKLVLERRLFEMISAELERFERATGVVPNGIYLALRDVTAVDDPFRRYSLTDITVEVELRITS